ncbi:hypothetical protein CU098_007743 [Rhizopus stolonifer]|uniref:HIG1 domain-containing protein n=1 Tax=Rhizopus stolonifer TaxID=4846 RepID=A0A367IZT2_RHIST|nr:hypothetical protein CU098_007743 [Rhizopus stolonifer]
MTKFLTPEQAQTRDKIFYTSGAKGALIGLGIGAAATAFVLKKSPEFRALSRPLQSIMAASTTTAGFLFASDRAATEFENHELGYADEEMINSLRRGTAVEENASTFDRSMEYLNKNRWSVIGLSWAVSMVGALGISFSNRYLTTQQKLVQARMYAQAVTIAVLMASAGVSIYVGDDGKNHKEEPDPQLRAVLALPSEKASEPKMVKQTSD